MFNPAELARAFALRAAEESEARAARSTTWRAVVTIRVGASGLLILQRE
jgi:hypothetical protein